MEFFEFFIGFIAILAVLHTMYVYGSVILREIHSAEISDAAPKLALVTLTAVAQHRVGLVVLLGLVAATRQFEVAIAAAYSIEVISMVFKKQLSRVASAAKSRVQKLFASE